MCKYSFSVKYPQWKITLLYFPSSSKTKQSLENIFCSPSLLQLVRKCLGLVQTNDGVHIPSWYSHKHRNKSAALHNSAVPTPLIAWSPFLMLYSFLSFFLPFSFSLIHCLPIVKPYVCSDPRPNLVSSWNCSRPLTFVALHSKNSFAFNLSRGIYLPFLPLPRQSLTDENCYPFLWVVQIAVILLMRDSACLFILARNHAAHETAKYYM